MSTTTNNNNNNNSNNIVISSQTIPIITHKTIGPSPQPLQTASTTSSIDKLNNYDLSTAQHYSLGLATLGVFPAKNTNFNYSNSYHHHHHSYHHLNHQHSNHDTNNNTCSYLTTGNYYPTNYNNFNSIRYKKHTSY